LAPALLERLKRRGIVVPDQKNGSAGSPDSDEEEVFAESYDPEDPVQHKEGTRIGQPREDENDEDRFRGGAPGCPNKNNQFHLCTDYCFDHWGDGYPETRLSKTYLEERKNMLNDYPLPEGWKEVYDAGIRRHYYWNTKTDDVCWFSPKHPNAVIGEAAPQIAKQMFDDGGALKISSANGGADDELPSSRKRGADDSARGGAGGRDRDRGDRERGGDRRERRRDRRRPVEDEELGLDIFAGGGGSSDEESTRRRRSELELTDRDRLKQARRRGLDPMDPAAYSDVSAGSWSAGLVEETKTGVDVTASGPLFQQRPYPAPGAVMRKSGKQNPDAKKD